MIVIIFAVTFCLVTLNISLYGEAAINHSTSKKNTNEQVMPPLVSTKTIFSEEVHSTIEEESIEFNMTEYLLHRLPVAPKPTENTCRLRDGRNDRVFKILVFVDNCYFSLFANWYRQYLDICGDRRRHLLEVVCMDSEVAHSLRHLGLTCSLKSFVMPNYRTYHRKQAAVWIKRLEVIIRFLDEGTDLLLSDTDAIWRSDPFVYIQQHLSTSFIVASRGNFPIHVFEKHGATICMGFAYFKASALTSILMKKVLHEMRHDRPDDQYAINNVLDKWNLRFPHYLSLEYNTVPNTGSVLATDAVYNITLLPHDKFIRNCTRLSKATNLRLTRSSVEAAQSAVSEAVVAHCVFSAGNAYSKFLSIRAYRLWHVDVPMPDPSSIIPTQGCIWRHNHTVANISSSKSVKSNDSTIYIRKSVRSRNHQGIKIDENLTRNSSKDHRSSGKVKDAEDNESRGPPFYRIKRPKRYSHSNVTKDEDSEDRIVEYNVDNGENVDNNNAEEANEGIARTSDELLKNRPIVTIGGGFRSINGRKGIPFKKEPGN